MFSTDQELVFETVLECAGVCSCRVFLVGGLVRDLLLGRNLQSIDLDFLVEGDGLVFGRFCVSRLGGQLKEFHDFCTCKVISPAMARSIVSVDFASARAEAYPQPGSLPRVQLVSSIEEDLKRRDFSINAMALELSELRGWLRSGARDLQDVQGKVVDLFSGQEDLQKKLIRILHPRSFLDDPTRIFRACRYAARLEGEIELGTARAIELALAGGALRTISSFRIQSELKKICLEKTFFQACQLLCASGALCETGLLGVKQESIVMEALRRVQGLPVTGDGERIYELFLALCVGTVTEERASEIATRHGLGRRRCQLLVDSVRSSRAVPKDKIGDLRDLALLLALCWDENLAFRSSLVSAAVKKGLLERNATGAIPCD